MKTRLMSKSIYFYAEASPSIGLGHVIRVNNLIGYFASKGYECHFYLNSKCFQQIDFRCQTILIQSIEDFIEILDVSSPDLLVLDLLEGDVSVRLRDHLMKARFQYKLACIDGFYDEFLCPDLSIMPWSTLPKVKRQLRGLSYLFFNDAHTEKSKFKQQSGTVQNILVSIGSSDPHSATYTILKNVCNIFSNINFHVVIGPMFTVSNRTKITNSQFNNVTYYEGLSDLSDLYLGCDIAIIGGGQTKFEASLFGLPALIISNTELEKRLALEFENLGLAVYVSPAEMLDSEKLVNWIQKLDSDAETLNIMSNKARFLVDGEGGNRIVNYVENELFTAC